MVDHIVRDFVYLDKRRMLSLYSQMFDGVVEAMIDAHRAGSRFISDNYSLEGQIARSTMSDENNVLFDHIYNSVEKKLENYIFRVNDRSRVDLIDFKNEIFVKVKGRAVVYDHDRLRMYVEKHNDLGRMLAFSKYHMRQKKDRKRDNPEIFCSESGYIKDDTSIDNIKTLSELFTAGRYDIVLSAGNSSKIAYKGSIDKRYLRIEPDMIRALYGDEPTMDWTMVGQVTYVPNPERMPRVDVSESKQPCKYYNNMLDVMRNMEKILLYNDDRYMIHIAPYAIYI